MRIALRSSLKMAVLALAALACSAGCETFSPAQTCDMSAQGNPPVVYAGGAVSGGVYASTPAPSSPDPRWPWDGPLLLFPGGMRYTIQHHLQGTPHWTQLWISFSSDGAGGGSTIAQAAGNEAQIEGIDDSTIEVVNYSCSQYYLLVMAGEAGTAPPGSP
jgi:hypothetical protein